MPSDVVVLRVWIQFLFYAPRDAAFNVQDGGETDSISRTSTEMLVVQPSGGSAERRRSDVKRGSSKGNDLQVPSQ
jgi:hypothetical protein